MAPGAPTSLLEPASFGALAGFDEDDCLPAFHAFARIAKAMIDGAAPLRGGRPAAAGLRQAARAALAADLLDAADARLFFTTHFRPFRVEPGGERGFLTGYYEPWVRGSRVRTPDFSVPILARPADLVTFAAGEAPAG